MAPVRPELPLLGNDLSVRSTSSDHAKLVLINNSSKLLHGADGTGLINVRLDGKAVGGPNIGEYLQIQVPKGRHTLEVCHLDVIKLRTEQEINVDQDLVIELKATPFSNKILVQSTMPAGDFRPLVIAADEPGKTECLPPVHGRTLIVCAGALLSATKAHSDRRRLLPVMPNDGSTIATWPVCPQNTIGGPGSNC